MRPKSDPSVPSSDLESARAAAERLVASRSAREAAAASAAPAWAKLKPPSREDETAAPALEPAEPTFDLAAIESAGERAWNAYLDWALASGPADGGFFADDHGLVITARGELP